MQLKMLQYCNKLQSTNLYSAYKTNIKNVAKSTDGNDAKYKIQCSVLRFYYLRCYVCDSKWFSYVFLFVFVLPLCYGELKFTLRNLTTVKALSIVYTFQFIQLNLIRNLSSWVYSHYKLI